MKLFFPTTVVLLFVSPNNITMKYLFTTIALFCLPLCAFSQIIEQADCSVNSIHCWEKVYVSGGEYHCSDWRTELNEEFDTFDTTVWKTYFGDGDRSHVPCAETLFFDENIEVRDNACVMHARHMPNSAWTNKDSSITYKRDFTGSVIEARNGFHYGRYEATILKMPARGWRCAFWMWHHEEIDIMEWFGHEHTYLYNSYPSHVCDFTNQATVPNDLYNGTHTFAVEWNPLEVIFYYNDEELPSRLYRLYRADETPLDIDCGDTIPAGYYYLNPNFPKPYRTIEGCAINCIKPTWLRPMLSHRVLPRSGLECCEINRYCYHSDCDIECNDWGSPVDTEGNVRAGAEVHSEMIVDEVIVESRDYFTCNAAILRMGGYMSVGELDTAILENIGNQNVRHEVEIFSIDCSEQLEVVNIDNSMFVIEALSEGVAGIEITFLDDCGDTVSISKNVHVSNESIVNVCQSAQKHMCCPDNTVFAEENCLFGEIPKEYNPYVQNRAFFVKPNCAISTENACCPPDYVFINGGCHSGFSFSQLYQENIQNGKYSVLPNCGDDKNVWVYPNPANELLNITFLHTLPDDVFIHVFDSIGRLHGKRVIKFSYNRTIQINVADLHPGMYFLHVQYGEITETVSFIKQL